MKSNVFGLPPRIAELLRTSGTNNSVRSEADRCRGTATSPSRASTRSGVESASPAARFFTANRALIVDGDAEAADLLATLLRLSNPAITTLVAHTAHAAVVLASEYRPDVVIVDLGAQALSGEVIAGGVLTACAEARPLMIALSGGGLGRSEARLRRVFDHVLAKPVELANLVSLVTCRPTLVQSRRS